MAKVEAPKRPTPAQEREESRKWTAREIVRRAIESSLDYDKQVKRVMKELKALEKKIKP